MHSSADLLRRGVRAPVLIAALLVALAGPVLAAQTAQSARLYAEATAREATLRKELDAYRPGMTSEPLLRRIRVLVGSFEDLARLFPTSSYSDDALWHGGMLAADAFWQFGQTVDRTSALDLLDGLASRYSASGFAKPAAAQVTRLRDAKSRRPDTPAVAISLAMPSATPTPGVALTSIRREVLPDTLRITLDLDREVSFRHGRLDAPARVFIDLEDARATETLKDATIAFTDDVVKQIQVSREIDSRTRVALNLTTPRSYSVYALYNPYRVVIDFERSAASALPPGAPGASRPASARAATAASVAPVAPPGPSRVAPINERPVAPIDAAPIARIAESTIAPSAPAANMSGGFSLSRQLGLGVARIVIDPGHGGRDPGAKVKGLTEANLVLDVALRLEKLLKKQKNVEVVLTRRNNSYVPLEERTAIANKSGADLFLSIHANASASGTARGVETYFLNFAPNPEAEAIAARENAGSSRSMRHLPDIVRAIALNNKIDESRDFATIVQSNLYDRLRKSNRELKNLGVKQAPFMVLIGATMPSILAEISFMTHSDEGSLLKTEKYRQQIAEALLAGVMRYQESLKKVPAVATTQ